MEVQWDTRPSGINELSAHEIIESRRSIKTVAAQSGRRGGRGCAGRQAAVATERAGADKQVSHFRGRRLIRTARRSAHWLVGAAAAAALRDALC